MCRFLLQPLRQLISQMKLIHPYKLSVAHIQRLLSFLPSLCVTVELLALQCLCATVCSGRGLLRLWMALCLSKLSPRLPRSSAIPPPLIPFSLCLITSLAILLHYIPIGPNPSCYTLTYCSPVYWPDKSHVRCIIFIIWCHNGAVRAAVPCDMSDMLTLWCFIYSCQLSRKEDRY